MILRKVSVLADLAQQVLILYKILALDQASKNTGYAIFANNQYSTHGLIQSSSSDLGVRLKHLRYELAVLILNNNINEVIFEDIQLQENIGNNVATFKTLAEVMGVIVELLTELNIPYRSVLSSEWRKRLKINGNSRKIQKEKAQTYVRNRYSLDVSEDEADALCIGTYRVIEEEEKNVFDWS